jgi:hypothetical protein
MLMANNYLTDDFIDTWEKILSDVDIVHVPIQYIDQLIIKTQSGQEIIVGVRELIEMEDVNHNDLETMIEAKINSLDEDIVLIDYLLNLKKIAEMAELITNDFLKDLK